MKHSLPVHPRTGLTALGFGKRGPIWPVIGGAEVDLQAFLALDADARKAHLASLSAEEFTALNEALEAHVAELLADESADVAALTAAADARDAVAAENGTREEAAAAAQAERDAARARLAGETVDSETEPETPADGETTDAEETPAETETAEGGETETPAEPTAEVREPVAAAAPVAPARPAPLPAVAAGAARTAPAPRARQTSTPPRGALVASADVNRISAGTALSRDQFIEAMTDKVNALMRTPLAGQQERVALVASAVTKYSEERTLGDDPIVNTRKMDAFAREAEKPGALTAAGGLCAPTAVDYALLDIHSDARPVRDGLPQLGVTRGGVRFMKPRSLAAVTSGVDQWTVTNDEDADLDDALTHKSRIEFDCQDTDEVLLYAVYTRALFRTMNARAYPEGVEADLKLLAAAHARKAELLLLAAIKAKGTAVTTSKLLGATRDLLAQFDVAAAYLRDRHRLAEGTVLEAKLPRHAKDMMRADLARQMPGDEALAVDDAQLAEWFRKRNVEVDFSLETTATAGGTAFANQSAGALVDFPDTIQWDIFPKGSFQYLDGGEIGMGTVRDSTLNNVNGYEMFGESFEAVAFRGVESLHVTSTVQPDGSAAGLVNTAGPALGSAQDL